MVHGHFHKGQGLRSRSKCNISIFNILSNVNFARVKVKGRKGQGRSMSQYQGQSFLRTLSSPSTVGGATQGRFHWNIK